MGRQPLPWRRADRALRDWARGPRALTAAAAGDSGAGIGRYGRRRAGQARVKRWGVWHVRCWVQESGWGRVG